MIAVLLILIPLVGGLAGFFMKEEKAAKSWSLFISIAALITSVLGLSVMNNPANLEFSAQWLPALGSKFSVRLDGMGQVLCLLTAIAFPIIFISTWNNAYKRARNFFALMLLSQAGLMGVFVAMDGLLFYFFWELALVPAYFLCSIWGGEKRIQVTFKFFIYTFLGSGVSAFSLKYIAWMSRK